MLVNNDITHHLPYKSNIFITAFHHSKFINRTLEPITTMAYKQILLALSLASLALSNQIHTVQFKYKPDVPESTKQNVRSYSPVLLPHVNEAGS